MPADSVGGERLAARGNPWTRGHARKPERGQVNVNDQEVLHALQQAWEEVREDLVRCRSSRR